MSRKKPTFYAKSLIFACLVTWLIGCDHRIETIAIAAGVNDNPCSRIRQIVGCNGPNALMGPLIMLKSTASQATVTVDQSQTLMPLPSNFIGLSYEADDLFSSKFISTGNLPALLRTLSPNGNLRIGGSTVDMMQPYPNKNVASLSQLALLIKQTHWKVGLAVNLASLVKGSVPLNTYTSLIRQEASDASHLLGTQLETLECGNEPQYYGQKPSYHYAVYLSYFGDCKQAIGQIAPVAGPDALTSGDGPT